MGTTNGKPQRRTRSNHQLATKRILLFNSDMDAGDEVWPGDGRIAWEQITKLDAATILEVVALLQLSRREPKYPVLPFRQVQEITEDGAPHLHRLGQYVLVFSQLRVVPRSAVKYLLKLSGRIKLETDCLHFIDGELTEELAHLLVGVVNNGFGSYDDWYFPSQVQISAPALKVLLTADFKKSDISLDLGLRELSDEVVDALASSSMESMHLTDIKQLTKYAAKSLASAGKYVHLSGEVAFEAGALRELVASSGRIAWGVRQLPPSFATELESAVGHLHLYALERLGLPAALILRETTAQSLSMGSLRSISDEVAGALAGCNALDVQLRGLTALGDGPGYVQLATRLARGPFNVHSPSLNLSRLAYAAPSVLECLAQTPAKFLYLGLTALSVPQSLALSHYDGVLYLPNVRHLTPECLAVLSLYRTAEMVLSDYWVDCEDAIAVNNVVFARQSGESAVLNKSTFSAMRSGLQTEKVEILKRFTPELLSDIQRGRPFPRLRAVSCQDGHGWLRTFPNLGSFPSLRTISLAGCHSLQKFVFTDGGDMRAKAGQASKADGIRICIVNCDSITSIEISTSRACANQLMLRGLPSCTSIKLAVTDMCDLLSLREINSLLELTLDDCANLVSLRGIEGCAKLKKLVIRNCPSLASIDGVQILEDCELLDIIDCPKLDSVSIAVANPGIKTIELSEATAVVSVREQLCGNHDNAKKLFVYSPDVRVPFISLVAAKARGLDPLIVYESAIIECLACGSANFEGECSGWYDQRDYVEPSCSASLEDGPLGDAVFKHWRSMAQELADLLKYGDDSDIEGAGASSLDWFARSYPEIHSSVRCSECSMPLGVEGQDILNRLFAVYTGGSTNEIELNEIKRDVIVIPFSERPVVGTEDAEPHGNCPICGVGSLSVGVRTTCFRSSAGKFGGSVDVQSNTYGHFSRSVKVEASDEKSGMGWISDEDEEMVQYLTCDSCDMGIAPSFFGPADPQDVVATLLAAISCHEALQKIPSVNRLVDWTSQTNIGVPVNSALFDCAEAWLVEMRIKIIDDDQSVDLRASTVDVGALKETAFKLLGAAATLAEVAKSAGK